MRVSATASAASSFPLSYLLPFSHSAPGYFILVAIEQAFNLPPQAKDTKSLWTLNSYFDRQLLRCKKDTDSPSGPSLEAKLTKKLM